MEGLIPIQVIIPREYKIKNFPVAYAVHTMRTVGNFRDLQSACVSQYSIDLRKFKSFIEWL